MAKTLIAAVLAFTTLRALAVEPISSTTSFRGVQLGADLGSLYPACPKGAEVAPANPCVVAHDEFAADRGQQPMQLKGLARIAGLGDSAGLKASAGKVHAVEVIFLRSTFPLVRAALTERFGLPSVEAGATLLRGRVLTWEGRGAKLTLEEDRDSTKGFGFATLSVQGPTASETEGASEALRQMKTGL